MGAGQGVPTIGPRMGDRRPPSPPEPPPSPGGVVGGVVTGVGLGAVPPPSGDAPMGGGGVLVPDVSDPDGDVPADGVVPDELVGAV
jgi:hypothetical protein